MSSLPYESAGVAPSSHGVIPASFLAEYQEDGPSDLRRDHPSPLLQTVGHFLIPFDLLEFFFLVISLFSWIVLALDRLSPLWALLPPLPSSLDCHNLSPPDATKQSHLPSRCKSSLFIGPFQRFFKTLRKANSPPTLSLVRTRAGPSCYLVAAAVHPPFFSAFPGMCRPPRLPLGRPEMAEAFGFFCSGHISSFSFF